MPTFCRHGRFLERCPICSKDLPANQPSAGRATRAKTPRGKGSPRGRPASGGRVRSESLRVRREGRAEDDGYSCGLISGVRASADARRLADEIGFASGRLLVLAGENPPGLYGEVRTVGAQDLEQASWVCFLIAYLSPLEGEDPFAGVRLALESTPRGDGRATGALPELTGVPVGPRSSHDPARGAATLVAYRQWVQRSGGSQALALRGDHAWTPQRRFERLHERLALPGFGRMGRYDLLVTLGRLGLYELRPGSLLLTGASAEDLTTLGAKRVFGIGDPLLLERRAAALAEAASVPIEALDLALANWVAPQRATVGVPAHAEDEDARQRAVEALEL
jgi:Alpha-glutamyl/putrescinyl thymine pyrophosphorylase clade 3